MFSSMALLIRLANASVQAFDGSLPFDESLTLTVKFALSTAKSLVQGIELTMSGSRQPCGRSS